MQASDTSDEFQKTVLEQLERLSTEVDGLKQELAQTNVRVDAYQKASTQVVNLAFGLIATATLTIIVSTLVK